MYVGKLIFSNPIYRVFVALCETCNKYSVAYIIAEKWQTLYTAVFGCLHKLVLMEVFTKQVCGQRISSSKELVIVIEKFTQIHIKPSTSPQKSV